MVAYDKLSLPLLKNLFFHFLTTNVGIRTQNRRQFGLFFFLFFFSIVWLCKSLYSCLLTVLFISTFSMEETVAFTSTRTHWIYIIGGTNNFLPKMTGNLVIPVILMTLLCSFALECMNHIMMSCQLQ